MIISITRGGRGSGSRRRTYTASTIGGPEITVSDGCMSLHWSDREGAVDIRMRKDDARLIAAALKLLEARRGTAN